jgi:excisionase family DNA binding protein
MTQGTSGTARKPQTGTARRASKTASRERRDEMIERTSIVIDTRPLMTLEEAARWLGVSRHTIGRWIDDGELRSVLVGSRRKVRPADIDAYLSRPAS